MIKRKWDLISRESSNIVNAKGILDINEQN